MNEITFLSLLMNLMKSYPLLVLGHMIKILKSSEESIQMKKLQVSGDYLLIDDIGVVVWLQKCLM